MDVSYVVLAFGFGDTSCPSFLAIPASRGFDSGLKALRQLSADLWVIYVAQRGRNGAPCCQESLKQDATFAYCPRCGSSLGQPSIEGFHNWCESLIYNHAALQALDETENWGDVWIPLEEVTSRDLSEILYLTVAEDWICGALPATVGTAEVRAAYQYESWETEVEKARLGGVV